MTRSPSSLPAGSEVILAEDDPRLRRQLAAHLVGMGATVAEASTLAEVRRLLSERRFDFALVDLHLPDGEALELLREKAFSENTGVVVMTAFGGVAKAVEAMRLGAGDYLSKPFEPEALPLAFARCRALHTTARREEQRQAEVAGEADGLFFGQSLQSVRTQLDTILAAERRLQRGLPAILIEGATGTGKTALARWLHRQGPRAALPFLPVNCAALPENLIESELFGHERGAFTDAKQARIGLFEAADGGTLLLDEISSLGAAAQAKVLAAVEEGKIRRVGGTREIAVDVRLMAASNRPLDELVREGKFREDLYHRLNLLRRIFLPPLRERGSDLVPLARHLLGRLGPRHGRPAAEISPTGEVRLLAQTWPGNIRELAHELERALIFGGDGPLDFAQLDGPAAPAAAWRNPAWHLPAEGFALESVVDDLVAEALRVTDKNVSSAARRLGVTREFLRYRLQRR